MGETVKELWAELVVGYIEGPGMFLSFIEALEVVADSPTGTATLKALIADRRELIGHVYSGAVNVCYFCIGPVAFDQFFVLSFVQQFGAESMDVGSCGLCLFGCYFFFTAEKGYCKAE